MANSTIATVSIGEYLRTSYRPDVEYIDGHLKEKPVVGFPHGRVQGFLFMWFEMHHDEWAIKAAVDTRTRVTADRVRLPDVVVVSAQEQATGALSDPPLVAIEVLSPTDTYADLKNRAADLQAMGTENIWLIDPDKRTAERWNGESWELHASNILGAVDSPIHVDLDWLWARLDG
jgi:Uma2 family endonuclease